MVSWYRSEGDGSDFVGDDDGTLNGATFTAGKVGQAFLFDGVDDRVSIPDSADQNPGTNFTVEAWINPSSSGHGRPIAQKRPGNLGGYTFETTHAPYAPNDGLQFVVSIGGSQHFLQTPEGVLTNNAWQHVAATYDGIALRIYVDGVEEASAPASGAIDTNTAPVVIGQNVVIPSFVWDGAIDEVSFYSRALTQAEIQTIVDAGSEGKELMVAWYRAEDNATNQLGPHDGVLDGGVGFGGGPFDRAFNLDGIDDSVDLGTWFNLQNFTIDMWVNPAPGTSQVQYADIIDNNHTDFRSWVLQYANAGNQYVWGTHDGAPGIAVDLMPNVWQHVAVTRDAATRQNRVYLNGELLGTTTGTSDITYDGSQFFRLGTWGGFGAPRNWEGMLDEVRIHGRPLTQAEIQAVVDASRRADMEVTISDSPDPVLIGDNVTYTVTVSNRGPLNATGVVVVARGPAGSGFNSVTIPVGGLPSGTSSSFHLEFAPPAVGTFSATATVTASEDDPNLANNSFTATTLVGPRGTFDLVQAQYEVREGELFAVLAVRRTGDLRSSGSVDFTTVNGTATQRGIATGLTRIDDFTTTSGELFFRAHSNLATIRVPIGDDFSLESDETFGVVLSNPSAGMGMGSISAAEVIIHDNDPTVQFAAVTMERSEASLSSVNQIEVKLQSASPQTITVAYAVTGGSAILGTDFTLPRTQTLTFRPGETRKFITLTLINDTLYEGEETAILELSSPTNAFLGIQARHRVTIIDNDPQPPPVEPGSTPDTALFIDLQTLPRQSFRDILFSNTDKDTFRVHLGANERLALDVDPSPIGDGEIVLFPGIATSTLVFIAPDKITELKRVSASAEPDTGVVTNNAAALFQATAAGDYYVRLEKAATIIAGYRLHFQRLGVSENVPAPELLNVAGAMYAWFDGTNTVGITGPTGYGFTLEGPWQQVVTGGRSILKSQTLTLPAGSQFTLASPQGVELPLLANGKITIKTNSNRWGNMVGEVTTAAIKFPVSLGIAPVNDLLADAFGSDVSVGVLTGDWRISLGGRTVAGKNGDKTEDIAPFLAGVPYLRQKSPVTISAQIGEYAFDYPIQEDNPIEVVFDPGDPMLYLRAEKIQNLRKPALGLSRHGLLEFVRQRDPAADLVEEFGHGPDVVPDLFGHVYVSGSVPFKIWYVPFEAHGDSVYNLDADRDGQILAGLFDGDDLFRGNFDDLPNSRDVLRDIQAGNNGLLLIKPENEDAKIKYAVHAGEATWVFNGPAESFWFRGQRGTGGSLFEGTPLGFLNVRSTDVLEAMVHSDGHFVLRATAGIGVGAIDLEFVITISNEGISASVTGTTEFSAHIDVPGGTVSGKATVEIGANISIDIDDEGNPRLSGSITASAKLKHHGTNLFSGGIGALVRNRGFRFHLPKGVGNIDLDLF